ncbi:hypothetical protein [Osedax japonicus RNA virus 1]|uniref:hypothetical protein n=1 Tax=Osedax japonicus RNA virus 1 TaxID=2079458 RepID=UPI000E331CEE|nr:hypothetical protein [Osedax japonicus RNA virus 1]BBC62178.1 hypothetical protein [Osedax japonicus RNA virus 1]
MNTNNPQCFDQMVEALTAYQGEVPFPLGRNDMVNYKEASFPKADVLCGITNVAGMLGKESDSVCSYGVDSSMWSFGNGEYEAFKEELGNDSVMTEHHILAQANVSGGRSATMHSEASKTSLDKATRMAASIAERCAYGAIKDVEDIRMTGTLGTAIDVQLEKHVGDMRKETRKLFTKTKKGWRIDITSLVKETYTEVVAFIATASYLANPMYSLTVAKSRAAHLDEAIEQVKKANAATFTVNVREVPQSYGKGVLAPGNPWVQGYQWRNLERVTLNDSSDVEVYYEFLFRFASAKLSNVAWAGAKDLSRAAEHAALYEPTPMFRSFMQARYASKAGLTMTEEMYATRMRKLDGLMRDTTPQTGFMAHVASLRQEINATNIDPYLTASDAEKQLASELLVEMQGNRQWGEQIPGISIALKGILGVEEKMVKSGENIIDPTTEANNAIADLAAYDVAIEDLSAILPGEGSNKMVTSSPKITPPKRKASEKLTRKPTVTIQAPSDKAEQEKASARKDDVGESRCAKAAPARKSSVHPGTSGLSNTKMYPQTSQAEGITRPVEDVGSVVESRNNSGKKTHWHKAAYGALMVVTPTDTKGTAGGFVIVKSIEVDKGTMTVITSASRKELLRSSKNFALTTMQSEGGAIAYATLISHRASGSIGTMTFLCSGKRWPEEMVTHYANSLKENIRSLATKHDDDDEVTLFWNANMQKVRSTTIAYGKLTASNLIEQVNSKSEDPALLNGLSGTPMIASCNDQFFVAGVFIGTKRDSKLKGESPFTLMFASLVGPAGGKAVGVIDKEALRGMQECYDPSRPAPAQEWLAGRRPPTLLTSRAALPGVARKWLMFMMFFMLISTIGAVDVMKCERLDVPSSPLVRVDCADRGVSKEYEMINTVGASAAFRKYSLVFDTIHQLFMGISGLHSSAVGYGVIYDISLVMPTTLMKEGGSKFAIAATTNGRKYKLYPQEAFTICAQAHCCSFDVVRGRVVMRCNRPGTYAVRVMGLVVGKTVLRGPEGDDTRLYAVASNDADASMMTCSPRVREHASIDTIAFGNRTFVGKIECSHFTAFQFGETVSKANEDEYFRKSISHSDELTTLKADVITNLVIIDDAYVYKYGECYDGFTNALPISADGRNWVYATFGRGKDDLSVYSKMEVKKHETDLGIKDTFLMTHFSATEALMAGGSVELGDSSLIIYISTEHAENFFLTTTTFNPAVSGAKHSSSAMAMLLMMMSKFRRAQVYDNAHDVLCEDSNCLIAATQDGDNVITYMKSLAQIKMYTVLFIIHFSGRQPKIIMMQVSGKRNDGSYAHAMAIACTRVSTCHYVSDQALQTRNYLCGRNVRDNQGLFLTRFRLEEVTSGSGSMITMNRGDKLVVVDGTVRVTHYYVKATDKVDNGHVGGFMKCHARASKYTLIWRDDGELLHYSIEWTGKYSLAVTAQNNYNQTLSCNGMCDFATPLCDVTYYIQIDAGTPFTFFHPCRDCSRLAPAARAKCMGQHHSEIGAIIMISISAAMWVIVILYLIIRFVKQRSMRLSQNKAAAIILGTSLPLAPSANATSIVTESMRNDGFMGDVEAFVSKYAMAGVVITIGLLVLFIGSLCVIKCRPKRKSISIRQSKRRSKTALVMLAVIFCGAALPAADAGLATSRTPGVANVQSSSAASDIIAGKFGALNQTHAEIDYISISGALPLGYMTDEETMIVGGDTVASMPITLQVMDVITNYSKSLDYWTCDYKARITYTNYVCAGNIKSPTYRPDPEAPGVATDRSSVWAVRSPVYSTLSCGCFTSGEYNTFVQHVNNYPMPTCKHDFAEIYDITMSSISVKINVQYGNKSMQVVAKTGTTVQLDDGIVLKIGQPSTIHDSLPKRVTLYNAQLYSAQSAIYGQTKATYFGDSGSKSPDKDVKKDWFAATDKISIAYPGCYDDTASYTSSESGFARWKRSDKILVGNTLGMGCKLVMGKEIQVTHCRVGNIPYTLTAKKIVVKYNFETPRLTLRCKADKSIYALNYGGVITCDTHADRAGTCDILCLVPSSKVAVHVESGQNQIEFRVTLKKKNFEFNCEICGTKVSLNGVASPPPLEKTAKVYVKDGTTDRVRNQYRGADQKWTARTQKYLGIFGLLGISVTTVIIVACIFCGPALFNLIITVVNSWCECFRRTNELVEGDAEDARRASIHTMHPGAAPDRFTDVASQLTIFNKRQEKQDMLDEMASMISEHSQSPSLYNQAVAREYTDRQPPEYASREASFEPAVRSVDDYMETPRRTSRSSRKRSNLHT